MKVRRWKTTGDPLSPVSVVWQYCCSPGHMGCYPHQYVAGTHLYTWLERAKVGKSFLSKEIIRWHRTTDLQNWPSNHRHSDLKSKARTTTPPRPHRSQWVLINIYLLVLLIKWWLYILFLVDIDGIFAILHEKFSAINKTWLYPQPTHSPTHPPTHPRI